MGWSWVEKYFRASGPARVESGPLTKAEVFDAEVIAIYRIVKRLARSKPALAKVFSDNLAAVNTYKYKPTLNL